jgi:glycosyltransferase involved in cell wall biosynthesis
MRTILLISPYWKEDHRWMVSSVKLAELWQRLGYRVVVACMGSVSSVERPSPTLTIYRRKDFFLPDPWNYGIAPFFTTFVRRIIRTEKPDIIIANKILFWSSFSVFFLRCTGTRVTLLTDALVGMTWWPRGRIPQICAAIYAWTAGWLIMLTAARIVFFHPQSDALLRRLGVAGKSQVIPTGIDPSGYGPKKEEGSSAVTVTYVGRLESVKGADDFVAATAPLRASFPNLTIRVAGWYKEGHPLVAQYDREVEFLGLRDDIPALLGATDIFVLPSYSEGLSNALMEAMASGCACIASDVGGNRFLIQNGISGFLFPPGDRSALTAHVRRLLEDGTKRRAMGQAARQRIEQQFSWEAVGATYRKLFESTV